MPHPYFLVYCGMQFFDGKPFLFHGIPVTQGNGLVFQGLVVYGDTKRCACGILPTVPPAYGVFIVIGDVEIEAKVVYDLMGNFRKTVFLYQG